jgi:toxin HigB-1
MVRSFADRDAEALFNGRFAKKLAHEIQRIAQRKLRLIHQAEELRDLAAPPGNRLEALKGDRRGQHSIRINDQWRICFLWRRGAAENVEIVDYHRG